MLTQNIFISTSIGKHNRSLSPRASVCLCVHEILHTTWAQSCAVVPTPVYMFPQSCFLFSVMQILQSSSKKTRAGGERQPEVGGSQASSLGVAWCRLRQSLQALLAVNSTPLSNPAWLLWYMETFRYMDGGGYKIQWSFSTISKTNQILIPPGEDRETTNLLSIAACPVSTFSFVASQVNISCPLSHNGESRQSKTHMPVFEALSTNNTVVICRNRITRCCSL